MLVQGTLCIGFTVFFHKQQIFNPYIKIKFLLTYFSIVVVVFIAIFTIYIFNNTLKTNAEMIIWTTWKSLAKIVHCYPIIYREAENE